MQDIGNHEVSVLSSCYSWYMGTKKDPEDTVYSACLKRRM